MLSALPALALSRTLTLAEQAKKAEVIVRASVGTAKSVKEGDVAYRAYPLEVKEVVAGEVASLPQLDGKPALFILEGLQDAPQFLSDQEAVLLLYARKLDSPLVGVNQGVYPIDNGKVKAGDITDPAKLIAAIRDARGGK